MTLRLADIVQALAEKAPAKLLGNPDLLIARLSPLETAGPQDLTFLSNPKYLAQLAQSAAGCVVVAPSMREAALSRGACIVAADPYYYLARAPALARIASLAAMRWSAPRRGCRRG